MTKNNLAAQRYAGLSDLHSSPSVLASPPPHQDSYPRKVTLPAGTVTAGFRRLQAEAVTGNSQLSGGRARERERERDEQDHQVKDAFYTDSRRADITTRACLDRVQNIVALFLYLVQSRNLIEFYFSVENTWCCNNAVCNIFEDKLIFTLY